MQRQSHSTTNTSSHESIFSLFTRVTGIEPAGSLSLSELEKWIRNNEGPEGQPDVRFMIEMIRAHYEQHGKDPGYQERKKSLPAFTPAGIFSPRKASGLEQHSSYIPLDFDGLPSAEDKAAIIAQLQEIPFVALAALSVADGVWALATVEPMPATVQEHTAAWCAVADAVPRATRRCPDRRVRERSRPGSLPCRRPQCIRKLRCCPSALVPKAKLPPTSFLC